MAVTVKVRVELDDGRALVAVADQRDFAAAEAMAIDPATKNTWVRFIAFSALARAKTYGGTWEAFNATDCIEASDVPEVPAGDEQGLDPGRKAPTAGS